MTVRRTRRPPNLVAATEKSIAAAKLDDVDSAAAEAMRLLARKIQAWDQIVEWALDDQAERDGSRPAVPQNDNVSLASYLKYCEALGLTPAARGQAVVEKKQEGPGGKLAQLRSVANRTA